MSNATEEIKPLQPLKPVLVPAPVVDPVVARNIERWKAEQAQKKAKRDKRNASIKAALKARFNREPTKHELLDATKHLISERRAKYLLKNCRATIGEIVKQHQEEGK